MHCFPWALVCVSNSGSRQWRIQVTRRRFFHTPIQETVLPRAGGPVSHAVDGQTLLCRFASNTWRCGPLVFENNVITRIVLSCEGHRAHMLHKPGLWLGLMVGGSRQSLLDCTYVFVVCANDLMWKLFHACIACDTAWEPYLQDPGAPYHGQVPRPVDRPSERVRSNSADTSWPPPDPLLTPSSLLRSSLFRQRQTCFRVYNAHTWWTLYKVIWSILILQ